MIFELNVLVPAILLPLVVVVVVVVVAMVVVMLVLVGYWQWVVVLGWLVRSVPACMGVPGAKTRAGGLSSLKKRETSATQTSAKTKVLTTLV